MNTLNQLLDRAKDAHKLTSDAAIAENLGVSRSAVSLWRKGGLIAEHHLAALVRLANADARDAVQVMTEQAQTKDSRAVWGALLDRLKAAAVAGIVAVALLPQMGHARPTGSLNDKPVYTLCEVLRRLRAALIAYARGFGHGSPAVLA